MSNYTEGPARELIDNDQAALLRSNGSLIVDDRRTRPQYFDGRFLTAQDLTREQNYFLSRQSDLGQASGGGIVHGLMVKSGVTASSIVIEAGHGITPAGELVLLARREEVSFGNLTEIQQLNARLGLSSVPSEPLRTRSGLFIIALRPIEFSDNPIASYPTSITGSRSVEDSDIVEAVAVTMIPYLDHGGNSDLNQRRASAARELFVERARRGVPENALPLAMVAVERGTIRWIDPYLVRREVGAAQTSFFGLGQAPRALREAHLAQYRNHLRDVLEERGANARIVAGEHFRALPPAGPMPLGSLDARDFTQSFFPVEVDAFLTVVPVDELGAIVEESLTLPPIDLMGGSEEMEATSVLIMLPIERRDWQRIRASLGRIERELRPAVPGLVAMRKPIQALQLLNPLALIATVDPGAVADEKWRDAIGSISASVDGFRAPWYVRRRNVLLGVREVGVARSLSLRGNEMQIERGLSDRVDELGLQKSMQKLKSRASAEANAGMVALLSSSKLTGSRLLLAGAVRELEEEKTLDQGAVLKVAARFDHPKLGEGLRRLETLLPALKEESPLVNRLAESGRIPDLDRLARLLPDSELQELSEQLQEAAAMKTAARLNRLLESKIKEMPS